MEYEAFKKAYEDVGSYRDTTVQAALVAMLLSALLSLLLELAPSICIYAYIIVLVVLAASYMKKSAYIAVNGFVRIIFCLFAGIVLLIVHAPLFVNVMVLFVVSILTIVVQDQKLKKDVTYICYLPFYYKVNFEDNRMVFVSRHKILDYSSRMLLNAVAMLYPIASDTVPVFIDRINEDVPENERFISLSVDDEGNVVEIKRAFI
ncbi:MAG: hypothetical protein K6G88_11660 [Lachnospiraceae bacterium]|nr:hypothetical protein [Lachnospiraceae bacterium]